MFNVCCSVGSDPRSSSENFGDKSGTNSFGMPRKKNPILEWFLLTDRFIFICSEFRRLPKKTKKRPLRNPNIDVTADHRIGGCFLFSETKIQKYRKNRMSNCECRYYCKTMTSIRFWSRCFLNYVHSYMTIKIFEVEKIHSINLYYCGNRSGNDDLYY